MPWHGEVDTMKTKKLALGGMLVVAALILSYVESLLPLSIGVPGIKMGLPNIAILFALYRLSFKDACAVSLVRILLVSILFGTLFSLAYSVAGAALSLPVMLLLKKSGKFTTAGVSVAGGVAHNAGQILVAMALLETAEIGYYLPILCVSGTVAGICVGLAAALLIRRVPHIS